MNINFYILFFSSLLAGLSVFLIPKLDVSRFKMLLSFSGAYLFSITVIHILPELFHEVEDIKLVGIYVLGGFFFQMILEYFSEGVEHGHIHVHDHAGTHVPFSLIIALCLHAFLEGTLLVHPSHNHGHDEVQTLLLGLVLHKIPEAFTLMSVLRAQMSRKGLAVGLLVFFSLASPMGLLFSDKLYHGMLVNEQVFVFLFALVAGNFLYISTTIFFETSPNHKFKANKLAVALLGALVAIAVEYFL